MTPRRILILESGFLPAAVIYNLLSHLEHLEVITSKFTTIRDLNWAIDTFSPHIFILDDAVLLEIAPAVLPLFKSKTILRTIIIHWEENEIEVYDRHKVEIKELTDFLAMF